MQNQLGGGCGGGGVPQAPPELWELRTSLQSCCTGKRMAQHAEEWESSHSHPDSHLGRSCGPYRPLVTSMGMHCLLEIGVHSPCQQILFCISRGNSCTHCPRCSSLWPCSPCPHRCSCGAGQRWWLLALPTRTSHLTGKEPSHSCQSFPFLWISISSPFSCRAVLPGAPTMLDGPAAPPSRQGTSGAN